MHLKIVILNASLMGLTEYLANVVKDKIVKQKEEEGYTVSVTHIDLNEMLQGQLLTSANLATFYDDIDTYIAILKSHDLIICSTSLINYHASPAIVAFFNKIALSGVTFHYQEGYPVPLIKEFAKKKVYVVASAGTPLDKITSGPATAFESVTQLFEYVGFSDIKLLYVTGTDAGENFRKPFEFIAEKYDAILSDI